MGSDRVTRSPDVAVNKILTQETRVRPDPSRHGASPRGPGNAGPAGFIRDDMQDHSGAQAVAGEQHPQCALLFLGFYQKETFKGR